VQTFEILGKKYRIQSSLRTDEAEKINGEIVKRFRSLEAEYPALDKIDILVLCIIELKEKISGMEKNFKKDTEKLDKIRNNVALLEKKIVEELKNLDKA
jgi:DNA repair ATPase RecN